MQQFCQYGSVRGATGNRRPYRDNMTPRRQHAEIELNFLNLRGAIKAPPELQG